MGKLHTLRRAVERNPEEFILFFGDAGRAAFRDGRWTPSATGAVFRGGRWEPAVCDRARSRLFPYRKFVRSVLTEPGYKVL